MPIKSRLYTANFEKKMKRHIVNDRSMSDYKRWLILLNLPPRRSKGQKHFTN